MVRLKGIRLKLNNGKILFQFHYGTIKSVKRPKWDTVFAHFNSTMVRLKEVKLLNANADIAFQFHYGTIKRAARTRRSGGGLDISIPLWYD